MDESAPPTLVYADEVFLSAAGLSAAEGFLPDLSERQRFGLDLVTREWLQSFARVVQARGPPDPDQLGAHAARLISGQLRALALGAEPLPSSPPLAATAGPPTPSRPPAISESSAAPATATRGTHRLPASEEYARTHARNLGRPDSRPGGNFWGADVPPEEQLLLATERGVWEPCYGVLRNAEWGRRFGHRSNRKVHLPRIAAISRQQALRAGEPRGSSGGICWVQSKRLVPFDSALLDRPVPAWVYG